MNCINFDQKFEQYMTVWVKNNAAKYKDNMDVIEGMMPDIYMEFLARPATWLGGKAPQSYFEQYDDAAMLVEWMCEYEKQRVPMPDLLLDRIGEVDPEYRVLLLSDHPTLLTTRGHDGKAIPFAIYDSREPGAPRKFDEAHAAATGDFLAEGPMLLRALFA